MSYNCLSCSYFKNQFYPSCTVRSPASRFFERAGRIGCGLTRRAEFEALARSTKATAGEPGRIVSGYPAAASLRWTFPGSRLRFQKNPSGPSFPSWPNGRRIFPATLSPPFCTEAVPRRSGRRWETTEVPARSPCLARAPKGSTESGSSHSEAALCSCGSGWLPRIHGRSRRDVVDGVACLAGGSRIFLIPMLGTEQLFTVLEGRFVFLSFRVLNV
ncbi:hypothetical protein NXF25_002263 [Crotalus adamanteus]|uniref:Uncharacterized protein n=1 Tax=Crotalus adamanteus TaxID=8729 RepID=A0AAW1CAK5_CROAD